MRSMVVLVASLSVCLAACMGGIDEDNDSPSAPAPGAGSSSGSSAAPSSGSGSATAPHQIDATDIAMLDLATHSDQFTQINKAAYTSQISATLTINNLVSEAWRDYAEVHPDTTGSGITMPVGSLIIRQVVDPTTGAVSQLTLMGKGPAGYDSTLGDWWFGVTDPTGAPLADGVGGYQVGKLTGCHGCHVPRANDDFLFGVVASNEANVGNGPKGMDGN